MADKKNFEEINDDTYLYFGSHNLSGGAWGNVEKDNAQLSIANWEIGVVFPPQEGSGIMKRRIVDSMVLKYPPKKYGPKDIPYMRDNYR